MSLVQTVITENFILVGSETRGIKADGSFIETVNKVIKVNNTIIFGCTGGVIDNYTLFDDFCDYSDENGLIPLKEEVKITYEDFVEFISKRFLAMYEKKHNNKNSVPYEIMSMICGYNGKEFEVVLLNINENIDNCIMKIHKPLNFPYKGISAGEAFHLINLSDFIQDIYFNKNGNMTLLHYKNAMKYTFEIGAEKDDGINDNLQFQVIRKKDVV